MKTVAEHEISNEIMNGNFDFIALGHIHDQCQITKNAWYSGSLEHCNYGEISQKKGGLIIDTDGDYKVEQIDLFKTDMYDFGTIKCGGLEPNVIIDETMKKLERFTIQDNSMGQIYYDNIDREKAKVVLQKDNFGSVAEFTKNMLHLKVKKNVIKDKIPIVKQYKENKNIDFVNDFAQYVKDQKIDVAESEYIIESGKKIIENAIIKRDAK